MSCNEFSPRIDELLDGLLPDADAALVREHATRCEACAADLDRAGRFRDVLAGRGRDAMQAAAAQRTAAAARSIGASEAAPAAAAVPVSRSSWRGLAAAAAVVAALATGYAVGTSEPAPRTAEPAETAVARGERLVVGEGRSLLVDEDAVLSRTSPSDVKLVSGAALFQVTPGQPLAVWTPQGVARVLGTCFHVRVHPATKAVSVTVLSGTVKFEPSATTQPKPRLRPGSILEVAADGSQRLTTTTQVSELEMRLDMQGVELAALRGDVARRDEELAVLRTPQPRKSRESAQPTSFDELPWREIGTKLRKLLNARDGQPADARTLEALGAVFAHAAEFEKATGTSRPWEWPLHPVVVERIAPSFFDALAPQQEPEARAAATAAVVAAAKTAQERSEAGDVPAEALAERLHLLAALLHATRDHLGDAPTAEIARFLTPERDGVLVRSLEDSKKTRTDLAAHWAHELDMSDTQRAEAQDIVEQYLTAVGDAQDGIAARLGEDDAEELFRTGAVRKRRPPGSEPDAAAIDAALARIDAKLELVAPRIVMERAILARLRADQRSRPLPAWGLVALRKAQ